MVFNGFCSLLHSCDDTDLWENKKNIWHEKKNLVGFLNHNFRSVCCGLTAEGDAFWVLRDVTA